MTKHNLILRISKVKNKFGAYSFDIGNNLTQEVECVELASETIKGMPAEELALLKKDLQEVFNQIFSVAKEHFSETRFINYKCIFSDKFIASGDVAVNNKSYVHSELVIPMDENECVLIFDAIPDRI